MTATEPLLPATLVLPAGLDLRMTWPERQLLVRREAYRRGQFELADKDLPALPDFLARVGGKMPERYSDMIGTTFVKQLEEFWTKGVVLGAFKPDVGSMLLNASAHYAFNVEWWEYEGRRVYMLDATTAHALLHTDIDDFPAVHLRFPVRSFYIRFPAELGWILSMDRPDVNLSTPVSLHPELEQPLEGVHVTVEGPLGGPVEAIQTIIAGRSVRAPEGDHVIWAQLGIGELGAKATIGEVVAQAMRGKDDWAKAWEFDRKVIRLALGALLYITSSHPHLQTIEPPCNATLAKASRDGDPAKAARAKHRSRYAITYVGGPMASFRTSTGTGDTLGYTRKPPRPHLRSGHMHLVWIGARDSAERRTEIRWFPPVMVGSWDRLAAWKAEQGYRFVINKTRPAEVKPGHAADGLPGQADSNTL